MAAEYRCLRCGNTWRSLPSCQSLCGKCGHLYVQWMNWPQWFIATCDTDPEYRRVSLGKESP